MNRISFNSLSNHRTLKFATCSFLGAMVFAGCTSYSGKGNEFRIEGPVVAVGDQSVTIYPEKILETHGQADGWFRSDDETQVHDNYIAASCFEHEVGHVYDATGTPESLSNLHEGEWIEIDGKIRDSKSGNYSYCTKQIDGEARPVFDEVHEIANP